jgi:predicted DCC family thiol-disulfide oxidoreductase YuxK
VEQATLVYDGDCGFCRWCVGKVLGWDRAGRVKAVPLGTPAADMLLADVDAATRTQSWHLVTPEGKIFSAGAAAAPLADLLPRGRPFAALFRSFPCVVDFAYRQIAKRRTLLGRWLTGNACLVPPRDG